MNLLTATSILRSSILGAVLNAWANAEYQGPCINCSDGDSHDGEWLQVDEHGGLFLLDGYLVVCERRWSAWWLRMHWQFVKLEEEGLGQVGWLYAVLIQNSLAETRLLLPDRSLALDVIGARSLYTKERFLNRTRRQKALKPTVLSSASWRLPEIVSVTDGFHWWNTVVWISVITGSGTYDSWRSQCQIAVARKYRRVGSSTHYLLLT